MEKGRIELARSIEIGRAFKKLQEELVPTSTFLKRFAAKRDQERPFNYLQLYTDATLHTWGSMSSINNVLDTVAHNASKKKQVILINGPLGAGKTTTRKRITNELQKKIGRDHVRSTTAEQALRRAVKDAKSGSYKQEHYMKGTLALKDAIKKILARDDIQVLVIETPLMTGFDVAKAIPDAMGGELLGMNRGTSAIEELFGKQGELKEAVDLFVIGIGRKNIRDALQNRLDENLGRRQRITEGGSYQGTIRAQKNIYDTLANHNYLLADIIGIPHGVVDNFLVYKTQIAVAILNWTYKEYLGLPMRRVLLCANEK